MMGIEQLDVSLQVTVVVAPVAVYFFLLGLLNSQSRPLLLSGRTDFILLNAAFFPAFLVPVLSTLAASAWAVLAVAVGLVIGVSLLAPGRWGHWVIYNISLSKALRTVERALQEMGEPFQRRGRRLVLARRDVTVTLAAVPLLRNVSLSTAGEDAAAFARRFESLLGTELSGVPAGANPLAAALLLIATAMLVTPLGLFADHVPQMVRLLTDLVK